MLEIPEWKVILYDQASQPVMDISRLVEFRLEDILNDSSTFNFSMDLTEFETLCASVSILPRNVLYPSLTEIKVYRNSVAMFGGIVSIANSRLEEVNTTIEVTADSYLHYFSKRLLNKSYTSTDRSAIAWDAIDTVQSETNGDLGITQGTLATVFDSDLTADYRDVKSIIQLYTYAQPTTYDFEITPDKVFNTYLSMGSIRTEYPLVYPQNITAITIPRSSDSLFNKIIGLGSGIGDERLESIQEDSASQVTYRVHEKKQLYNSVILQDTLDENTQGFLEQSKGVLVLPSVSVLGGAIDIDIVKVGDWLPVRIASSAFNDDVDGIFRIYKMTIKVDRNGNEDVSLGFYEPTLGGEVS
jgi:hypothetical protein